MDGVDAYVTWMVGDKTYLYECFDLATPLSFLERFAKTAYVSRDPHFFIPMPDGAALVRERDGYVEIASIDEAVRRVVETWYGQCEKICDKAASLVVDNPLKTTITYPKMRSRLGVEDIVAHLGRLKYAFAHRVDAEAFAEIAKRRILVV